VTSVLVLKVRLANARSIWRRVALRGNQTLDDLHDIIFEAFERYDEHLFSFHFPPASKIKSNPRMGDRWLDEGPSYAADGQVYGPEVESLRLDRLKLKPRQKFFYVFDFGDEWWHEIEVEAVDAEAEKGKYPRILETKGKSPPQYGEPEE
jgi:hypothetical protein